MAAPVDAPVAEQRPFRTVLLATDLSPASDAAERQAIALAAGLGARLLVVHVMDARRVAGGGSHGRMDQARAEREALLLALVGRARAAGAGAEFLIWTGDPASAIASAAEAEGADLLVVGSRGRGGAERLLLGSVSDHLVRTAGCPVLVVRPAAEADPAPDAGKGRASRAS
ncbi:MAG: universal stress protein [Chloroflexota bacterium]